MQNIFILNAPWLFAAMWRLVKPFVAPRTLEKIQIFGASDNFTKVLHERVDAATLPKRFGGQIDDILSVPAVVIDVPQAEQDAAIAAAKAAVVRVNGGGEEAAAAADEASDAGPSETTTTGAGGPPKSSLAKSPEKILEVLDNKIEIRNGEKVEIMIDIEDKTSYKARPDGMTRYPSMGMLAGLPPPPPSGPANDTGSQHYDYYHGTHARFMKPASPTAAPVTAAHVDAASTAALTSPIRAPPPLPPSAPIEAYKSYKSSSHLQPRSRPANSSSGGNDRSPSSGQEVVLTWRFQVVTVFNHDIGFCISFHDPDTGDDAVVVPYSRISADKSKVVSGSYETNKLKGMFRVTWDNTYSMLTSKTIAYTIEAHQRILPPLAAPLAPRPAEPKEKDKGKAPPRSSMFRTGSRRRSISSEAKPTASTSGDGPAEEMREGEGELGVTFSRKLAA